MPFGAVLTTFHRSSSSKNLSSSPSIVPSHQQVPPNTSQQQQSQLTHQSPPTPPTSSSQPSPVAGPGSIGGLSPPRPENQNVHPLPHPSNQTTPQMHTQPSNQPLPHHQHQHLLLVKSPSVPTNLSSPMSGSEQLRQASAVGDFDRVKELCHRSVAIDADKEGRTALHYGSVNGHLQIVRELIAAGAKVNVRDVSGFTPLHLASSEGHVELVNFLLKNGALVDAQDELGNTALHEAAWKGFSQTIEVLLKHKANAYIKNKGGFSALHLSCQQGHNGSARVLLLARCRPDLKNNYGDTPLHTSARYGHAGVARILISAFCTVSPLNKNGDTPLHITAAMGRRKLTKIFLQAGCNQNLKNLQGETAMDIAIRKKLRDVADILRNPPSVMIRSRSASSGTRNHKNVVFSGEDRKMDSTISHDSPYGCPQHQDLTAFSKLKLNSLPSDPLKKGEQYFVDLAGNIKKGPNASYSCNCKPFFKKVERKLDSDKQEIKDHIDCRHDKLNKKINHLEKKTTDMNETFKEKLASERQECQIRSQKSLLKDRMEYERRHIEHRDTVRAMATTDNSIGNPSTQPIMNPHPMTNHPHTFPSISSSSANISPSIPSTSTNMSPNGSNSSPSVCTSSRPVDDMKGNKPLTYHPHHAPQGHFNPHLTVDNTISETGSPVPRCDVMGIPSMKLDPSCLNPIHRPIPALRMAHQQMPPPSSTNGYSPQSNGSLHSPQVHSVHPSTGNNNMKSQMMMTGPIGTPMNQMKSQENCLKWAIGPLSSSLV